MKKIVLLFALLFAVPASADITFKLGPIVDSDGGAARMVWLAGADRTGLALNFGQTLHENGVDDGDNEFIGVDWFTSWKRLRVSIGAAYFDQPLHLDSQRVNVHLGAGVIHPINRVLSVGAYFDHWSNCRRICNYKVDEIKNDPRNVLSLGLSLAL